MNGLRWHAQRAGWSAAEIARARAKAGGPSPRIEFVAEAEACPVCASPLQIEKGKRRKVITLQVGEFSAKEVRKTCKGNASDPVMCSDALARLVRPHQCYSYDLIVHVGLARYLCGK